MQGLGGKDNIRSLQVAVCGPWVGKWGSSQGSGMHPSLPTAPAPCSLLPSVSPAGEITTTSLLDREAKSEYILIVRALDGGVGHNQKTGIATVSAHGSPRLVRWLLTAPSLGCCP